MVRTSNKKISIYDESILLADDIVSLNFKGSSITGSIDMQGNVIEEIVVSGGGAVDSVNSQTGVVVLTTADIADSTNKRYVTDANLTTIGNQSGTNTGDNAVNSLYSGLVSNATHTGDAEGATALTVKRINGVALSGLATGILKNTTTTGVPSIAVAGDFPTLNQNTTGSAATLTTTRAIYGNNFNGSAALTQIIASTYGGTGNGFTKFSGPTTTEKTFTLPDASSTIVVQGGALGTPTSGTLTNCTGLPAASIVAGIIGVTGTRMTKIWTTDIESTNAPTVGGVVVPTISSTSTLTNKRVNPRTASSTTASTLTPDLSSANVYFRTTQTATLTINAPTGTPVIGETIAIYVDSAASQTLTMDATYIAFGSAFPATTTAGKTLMITAQYTANSNWATLWANKV